MSIDRRYKPLSKTRKADDGGARKIGGIIKADTRESVRNYKRDSARRTSIVTPTVMSSDFLCVVSPDRTTVTLEYLSQSEITF